MNIEEKDVSTVNRLLSQRFCLGDKWVSWDDNGSVKPGSLETFKNIADANQYCEERQSLLPDDDFRFFKFKPIINALKSITGASNKSKNQVDGELLDAQIKQYPIHPFNNATPLAELLSDGQYHPVKIEQQILPWKDIEKYTVIEHEYPRGMIYEVGHSSILHGSFPSYYEAQKRFDELVAKNGSWQLYNPEIKLIGNIKEQKLDFNLEDFPQPGTGVLFKIAN